ncbi:MAG: hypothetical protein HY901_16705, partial [Deltaproteobacteria bacterium]|nr:hypothetical protein [Deltaproteobacteria bacterium]
MSVRLPALLAALATLVLLSSACTTVETKPEESVTAGEAERQSAAAMGETPDVPERPQEISTPQPAPSGD